jgi:hypothetical protein
MLGSSSSSGLEAGGFSIAMVSSGHEPAWSGSCSAVWHVVPAAALPASLSKTLHQRVASDLCLAMMLNSSNVTSAFQSFKASSNSMVQGHHTCMLHCGNSSLFGVVYLCSTARQLLAARCDHVSNSGARSNIQQSLTPRYSPFFL